jgi:hypothetical protein
MEDVRRLGSDTSHEVVLPMIAMQLRHNIEKMGREVARSAMRACQQFSPEDATSMTDNNTTSLYEPIYCLHYARNSRASCDEPDDRVKGQCDPCFAPNQISCVIYDFEDLNAFKESPGSV